MKRPNIPPTYFFSSLACIVLIYFLFASYNIIPFPFNLSGLIFMYVGLIMNKNARDLFIKYQTSHRYEGSTYLIKDGIYSRTRNPMYLGMSIFILGAAICFGNIISLVIPFLFLSIIHLIFIPFEEKNMETTFGKDYIEYKKKVRKWI